MSELAELERRISAALTRIGAGLDRLPSADAPVDQAAALAAAQDRIAALEAALAAAADAAPDLAPAGADSAALIARIDELTRQIDVQGLEMQRLRQTTIQLRETLRQMREQAQIGVEPHLINKALLAEIEALRAARSSEIAELDAILAELAPLLPANPPLAPSASPDFDVSSEERTDA